MRRIWSLPILFTIRKEVRSKCLPPLTKSTPLRNLPGTRNWCKDRITFLRHWLENRRKNSLPSNSSWDRFLRETNRSKRRNFQIRSQRYRRWRSRTMGLSVRLMEILCMSLLTISSILIRNRQLKHPSSSIPDLSLPMPKIERRKILSNRLKINYFPMTQAWRPLSRILTRWRWLEKSVQISNPQRRRRKSVPPFPLSIDRPLRTSAVIKRSP